MRKNKTIATYCAPAIARLPPFKIQAEGYQLPDAQAGPQEQFLKSDADVAVYGGAAGGGKAQAAIAWWWARENISLFNGQNWDAIADLVPDEVKALDSKILMADGSWKIFSAIKIGDQIINPAGVRQSVIAIYEQGFKPMYRWYFEDGTNVLSSDQHLWAYWKNEVVEEGKFKKGCDAEQRWNARYLRWANLKEAIAIYQEWRIGKQDIFMPVCAALPFKGGKDVLAEVAKDEQLRKGVGIKASYLCEELEVRWAIAKIVFRDAVVVGDELILAVGDRQYGQDAVTLARGLGYIARLGYVTDGCQVIIKGGNPSLLKDGDPTKVDPGWCGKRVVKIQPVDEVNCRCITVSHPNGLYVTDGYNVTHNSYGLLLDFAQQNYIENGQYKAVIFRRTHSEVKKAGGLWDDSGNLYPLIGGVPNASEYSWRFASGSKIEFGHLQYEKDKYSWQGAQIARLGFDELTHFTDTLFWYMFSRNRTVSGIKPRIRATTNPDADSWVAKLIDWWIDEDGFPIPERSGKVRWFVRIAEEVHWADYPYELMDLYGDDCDPKSFTFIASNIFDNKIFLQKDPGYLSNLKALHPVERARLLEGNWRIRYEAGKIYSRFWFEIKNDFEGCTHIVRFWDIAATAKSFANDSHFYTAGVKMGRVKNRYGVYDAIAEQVGPGEVETLIKRVAEQDGKHVRVFWELEGGSSGILWSERLKKELTRLGYVADYVKPRGDKVARALPYATATYRGHVCLVRGGWNDMYTSSLERFDGSAQPLINDIADASSGAYDVLGEEVDYAKVQATTKHRESRFNRKRILRNRRG